MTIAENLQRIQKAKTDIRNAIIEKGVQVDSTLTIDDFAEKILQIEGGGGGEDTLGKLMLNEITTYSVPNGATAINDYFFKNQINLQTINLSPTVKDIGICSFQNCNNLTSINLDDIETIGASAFTDCSKIESVNIGSKGRTIGDFCFVNCPNIKTIKIDSIERIGQRGFYRCSGATSLSLPENIRYIGMYAFESVSKINKALNFPNIEEIVDYAFRYGSGFTEVRLGASLRRIGTGSFGNCNHLGSVYCGNYIPTGTGNAFSTYTGGTLHIPYGTEQYYRQKWSGSTSLLGSSLHWNVVEDFEYEPKNVIVSHYNVTSTTSPTKLWAANNLWASGNTTNATGSTIWIEETPQMYSGSGYTFSSTGIKEVRIDSAPSTWGSAPYRSVTTLVDITIPSNCDLIPISGFGASYNLSSVTISDGVKGIDQYAFYQCSGLTSINIPDSVKTIGQAAFNQCYSLTDVTMGNGVETIPVSAFTSCRKLTSVKISDSAKIIGNRSFAYCSGLTSVTIPDSVKTIDAYAFSWCYSLADVTIGNGVETIGESAFSTCSGLTSVTIPDSVKTIGGSAFYQNTNLTSITIPDSVTTIENNTFNRCRNCLKFDFGNTRTTIPTLVNAQSFAETNVNKKIIVPDALYDDWIKANNWSSTANNIKTSIIKYSDYYV